MYKHGAKKTRQSSIVNYWKKVIQVFDSNLEIDEWAAPKRKLSQRSNETEIANDFELQMILMSFKHAPRSSATLFRNGLDETKSYNLKSECGLGRTL